MTIKQLPALKEKEMPPAQAYTAACTALLCVQAIVLFDVYRHVDQTTLSDVNWLIVFAPSIAGLVLLVEACLVRVIVGAIHQASARARTRSETKAAKAD